jgi:hypothetical protein
LHAAQLPPDPLLAEVLDTALADAFVVSPPPADPVLVPTALWVAELVASVLVVALW